MTLQFISKLVTPRVKEDTVNNHPGLTGGHPKAETLDIYDHPHLLHGEFPKPNNTWIMALK